MERYTTNPQTQGERKTDTSTAPKKAAEGNEQEQVNGFAKKNKGSQA